MAAEASREDSQPFDMRLSETATAQDVSEAALNAYAHILGEEPSLKLLARRCLLDNKNGRPTNAGALLFARSPGEHIVRAGVSVEVRANAQRATLAKRGWMREPGVGISGILDSMGGAGAHHSVSRELGSDHTKLTLIQQRERGGA